jgi:hypothetical protein
MTKDELLQALEEGRLEFAPALLDAYFPPGFMRNFFDIVFLTELEWCGVTEESLVTDFAEPGDADQVFKRIRRRYGVDCASLPDLKVATVLRACEGAVGSLKYH